MDNLQGGNTGIGAINMDNTMAEQLKLGTHIRLLRRQYHWNQEELAERVGMSLHYFQRIEQGYQYPTLYMLCRIAAALGVKPHELIKG